MAFRFCLLRQRARQTERSVDHLMQVSSTTSTRRREVLSRDERRLRILAASQRVFASRPYDEIAIDDLAAEAGMSKGLLYHYFPSKRDLYLETLRDELTTVSQITESQHN